MRRPSTTSLFARTFLLIALVLCASLLLWAGFFRAFERTPRAQQVAWEVASVVNLTRAALVTAQPDLRRRLLDDLAQEEGVRVEPAEPGDRVRRPPDSTFIAQVEARLRQLLGSDTALASVVNDERAFWVRFHIEGDEYWMAIDEDRVDRQLEPDWSGWTAAALAVSMAAAAGVSRWLNRPLAALARAIAQLSQGERPAPLPEDGPGEIARLNRRFNRLAAGLAALETDRTVALAGISHDLRTPLTRLRLELELAPLDTDARASMAEEIERIDRIVGQFVEFARDPVERPVEAVDVAATIDAVARANAAAIAAGRLAWQAEVPAELRWHGRAVDLERILGNLVDNALRYGASPDGVVRLAVCAEAGPRGVRIEVRDHGPGVPATDLERLLRPFARVDTARSESAGGAGLGLAIVARLAERAGGRVDLALPDGGGLAVRVQLRDAGYS